MHAFPGDDPHNPSYDMMIHPRADTRSLLHELLGEDVAIPSPEEFEQEMEEFLSDCTDGGYAPTLPDFDPHAFSAIDWTAALAPSVSRPAVSPPSTVVSEDANWAPLSPVSDTTLVSDFSPSLAKDWATSGDSYSSPYHGTNGLSPLPFVADAHDGFDFAFDFEIPSQHDDSTGGGISYSPGPVAKMEFDPFASYDDLLPPRSPTPYLEPSQSPTSSPSLKRSSSVASTGSTESYVESDEDYVEKKPTKRKRREDTTRQFPCPYKDCTARESHSSPHTYTLVKPLSLSQQTSRAATTSKCTSRPCTTRSARSCARSRAARRRSGASTTSSGTSRASTRTSARRAARPPPPRSPRRRRRRSRSSAPLRLRSGAYPPLPPLRRSHLAPMLTTDARHTGTPESRAAAAYSLSSRAPALSAQRTRVRAARSPWRATLKRAGMWLVCGRIARASLGGVDFSAAAGETPCQGRMRVGFVDWSLGLCLGVCDRRIFFAFDSGSFHLQRCFSRRVRYFPSSVCCILSLASALCITILYERSFNYYHQSYLCLPHSSPNAKRRDDGLLA